MAWQVTVNWKDGTTEIKQFKKYSSAERFAYGKMLNNNHCRTFKIEEVTV